MNSEPSDFKPSLTPDILLNAYAQGIFPMAENQDTPHIFWVEPEQRCVFPLNSFHIPRSLKKMMRHNTFDFYVDRDFAAIIDLCAEAVEGRPSTWINKTIRELYLELHHLGYAHSVEVFQNNKRVGGLYGVKIGSAFFGESMFSRVPNASKAALVHLVGRLKKGGFTLLDAQFITDHLKQFGAIEIDKERYRTVLNKALEQKADFYCWPRDQFVSGIESLQASSHTS